MFNFFGGHAGGNFEAHYRAMPVAFIDKGHAEHGDKVILPPSALDRLGMTSLCAYIATNVLAVRMLSS
jgi:hypothetical protein